MRTQQSLIPVTLTATVIMMLCFPAVTYAGDKKPLKFQVLEMGEGPDTDATEAGFRTGGDYCVFALTSFKVSNGERATMRSAYFATADEANRYFEWYFKSIEKVKEKGNNISAGKSVGKRAVAWARGGYWEVMWTDGSTFRSFASSDLPTALELERLNKRGDFWNKVLSPQ